MRFNFRLLPMTVDMTSMSANLIRLNPTILCLLYIMTAAAKTNSTMQLPRLGLGMAALGRPGYINLNRNDVFGSADERSVDTMRDTAYRVLDRLFQQSKTSVPWIDCARSYGLSEQFVGDYLRSNSIRNDQAFVSSKWGYTYVADFQVALTKGQPHEIKDHSVSNFKKQLEETKQCIGEYVDLYQIHSATFDSGVLSDDTVHQALWDAKQTLGWKLGLSVSGPSQGDIIRAALKIQIPGSSNTPLFDSIQCTFNLFEQSASSALLQAYENGKVTIIIKEGLANGRILQNKRIVQAARDLSTTVDALALACILAQPFQPSVLSGAVTPDQLTSNWQALELLERADFRQMLPTLIAECKVDSRMYWDERSALVWN